MIQRMRQTWKCCFAIIAVSCVVGLSVDLYTSRSSLWIFVVSSFDRKSDNPLNDVNMLGSYKEVNVPEKFKLTQNFTSMNLDTAVGINKESIAFPSTNSQNISTLNQILTNGCKETLFVQCSTPEAPSTTNRSYIINWVRRPFWYHIPDLSMTSCPYKNCRMLDSPVTNQTDLVLWYGVGLYESLSFQPEWSHLPQALAVWEPPIQTHSSFIKKGRSVWNRRINLIMSYRTKSDIFAPYNRLTFEPIPFDLRPDYYEIARNKSRTVYWFVSHCNALSDRDKYVKEMKKYVDVDIYGRCGQRCSNTTVCTGLETKYKFYLSFENSLCTDYLTEKFFKMFAPNTHVIPVVRSATDVRRYFPEKTFIDASDFKSAKDLALHLKQLGSDLAEYSKYLEIKDSYRSGHSIDDSCQWCTYLNTHQHLSTSKTYNLTATLGLEDCHAATDV